MCKTGMFLGQNTEMENITLSKISQFSIPSELALSKPSENLNIDHHNSSYRVDYSTFKMKGTARGVVQTTAIKQCGAIPGLTTSVCSALVWGHPWSYH